MKHVAIIFITASMISASTDTLYFKSGTSRSVTIVDTIGNTVKVATEDGHTLKIGKDRLDSIAIANQKVISFVNYHPAVIQTQELTQAEETQTTLTVQKSVFSEPATLETISSKNAGDAVACAPNTLQIEESSHTIFTISASERKHGIYNKFSDYYLNTPVPIDDSVFLLKILNENLQTNNTFGKLDCELQGDYYELRKMENGKSQKWDKISYSSVSIFGHKVHSEKSIFGYSDYSGAYVFENGYFSPIVKSDTIIWYSSVNKKQIGGIHPTSGFGRAGGFGGRDTMMIGGKETVTESIITINSKSGVESTVDRESLLTFLTRYPDLKQAYESQSIMKQNSSISRYFFRYARRLNQEIKQ